MDDGTVATWGAPDALDTAAGPDGIPQRRLADLVRVEQATMTVQLGRMATAGLCRRSPDPHDKRVTRVAITERGRELLDRLRRGADAARHHRGASSADLDR